MKRGEVLGRERRAGLVLGTDASSHVEVPPQSSHQARRHPEGASVEGEPRGSRQRAAGRDERLYALPKMQYVKDFGGCLDAVESRRQSPNAEMR